MANSKCKECGCSCKKCIASDHDVHLHVEIENLKQKLVERETHIVSMETNFLNEANKFPNGELMALREELLTWQDKYRRLYDAHRRVQRVNQGLEDKLLRLVDVCETEKTVLTKDVATLSQKLAEANYTIKKLSDDNERYKKDVSLAIQFLQCKQSNFVAHKFDSLPEEVQTQVSSFMNTKRTSDEKRVHHEMKSIKVPIPTFPPTAMVYSVPKSPKTSRTSGDSNRKLDNESIESSPPQVDIVSAAIMAKVLEERQREKAFTKHCDTCICVKNFQIIYNNTHHNIGTQTDDCNKNFVGNNICIKCNNELNLIKIVPISDAKNSNSKKVPIYPNDNNNIVNEMNIVKVQPNNFLLDKTDEISIKKSNDNTKLLKHHHLCSYDQQKNDISDNMKGPRYCSMRLQTGTRNILLDNAHNNVAPVLYTRHHKSGNKHRTSIGGGDVGSSETPKTHNISNTGTGSCSSQEDNRINNSLISDDNSTKNQQRVADWIQFNLDNNDMSSLENSQSDNSNKNIKLANLRKNDKQKYAEMEENVKRFLFGESEFLKTVEIGKLKYQQYRDESNSNNNGPVNEQNSNNQSNSHTETDI